MCVVAGYVRRYVSVVIVSGTVHSMVLHEYSQYESSASISTSTSCSHPDSYPDSYPSLSLTPKFCYDHIQFCLPFTAVSSYIIRPTPYLIRVERIMAEAAGALYGIETFVEGALALAKGVYDPTLPLKLSTRQVKDVPVPVAFGSLSVVGGRGYVFGGFEDDGVSL